MFVWILKYIQIHTKLSVLTLLTYNLHDFVRLMKAIHYEEKKKKKHGPIYCLNFTAKLKPTSHIQYTIRLINIHHFSIL